MQIEHAWSLMPLPLPEKPLASAVFCYFMYEIARVTEPVWKIANNGERVNHGYASLEGFLWPVVVEHDRSPHAERHALLRLMEKIFEKESDPGVSHEPRPHIEGLARMFVSHTPCISCLGCFCQFRRIFPEIFLYIEFTDWKEVSALTQAQADAEKAQQEKVNEEWAEAQASETEAEPTPW